MKINTVIKKCAYYKSDNNSIAVKNKKLIPLDSFIKNKTEKTSKIFIEQITDILYMLYIDYKFICMQYKTVYSDEVCYINDNALYNIPTNIQEFKALINKKIEFNQFINLLEIRVIFEALKNNIQDYTLEYLKSIQEYRNQKIKELQEQQKQEEEEKRQLEQQRIKDIEQQKQKEEEQFKSQYPCLYEYINNKTTLQAGKIKSILLEGKGYVYIQDGKKEYIKNAYALIEHFKDECKAVNEHWTEYKKTKNLDYKEVQKQEYQLQVSNNQYFKINKIIFDYCNWRLKQD